MFEIFRCMLHVRIKILFIFRFSIDSMFSSHNSRKAGNESETNKSQAEQIWSSLLAANHFNWSCGLSFFWAFTPNIIK